jgi:hypothetical protein
MHLLLLCGLFFVSGMVMDGSFTVGALASYCLYANQLRYSPWTTVFLGPLTDSLHIATETRSTSLKKSRSSFDGLFR